jgi:hypothetical protein
MTSLFLRNHWYVVAMGAEKRRCMALLHPIADRPRA